MPPPTKIMKQVVRHLAAQWEAIAKTWNSLDLWEERLEELDGLSDTVYDEKSSFQDDDE
jgi:hypothetical protein